MGPQRTPVEVATSLVGDAWAVLVLREAVLLGTRRFVDFRDSLQVNRATLVDRLNGLVDGGLLARRSTTADSERTVYVPTESGEAYLPVLLALLEWGRRWQVAPDEGVLLHVTHRPCGATLAPTLTCLACDGAVQARSVDAQRPGDDVRRAVAESRVRMPRLDQLERGHPCPIARCLSTIGDRWSMLIIQEAFYGLHHFDGFTRRLGIAPNTLSNRLARLCDHAVLDRRPNGSRATYRLTEKGLDLYPVPATTRQWSIERLGANDPQPLHHRWCRKPLTVVTRCTVCGQPIEPGEVAAAWHSH